MPKTSATSEIVAAEAWRIHPAAMMSRLDKNFVRYRHIEYISRLLARRIFEGGKRIIITCPPRHGKSHLVSRGLPVWFLSMFPTKRVLLGSYGADFAASWGRQARDIVEANADKLPISVRRDVRSSEWWETTDGGAMMTVGVDGPATGKGGDLLIIDDYVKDRADADSPTMRRRTIDWWRDTFSTRAEPGATIIVMATRWHEGDLIGFLLSDDNEDKDSWEVIELPALAEEGDLLGRAFGEALCPERYDELELLSIRRTIGVRGWSALYGCRPTSEQGDMFLREWFMNRYKVLPNVECYWISVDATFKDKETSDYVAIQVWGPLGPNDYLIHEVNERMGFLATVQAIRDVVYRFPGARGILIEDKANGPAIIETLKQEFSNVIAVEPEGSKLARADAITPRFESGSVFLPDPSIAPWVSKYIEEHVSFPNGKNDDRVDATSQYLIRRQLKKNARPVARFARR